MKRPIRILCAALALTLALTVPAAATDPDPELAQTIVESCTYGQSADLSAYQLSAEDFEAAYMQLYTEGQLPWYATNGYGYYYNEDTGLLTEFSPDNLDPAVYDRDLYEQRLAEIMALCILEGMTPAQIALSVHDFLILNCVYDETLAANTGYDLLINGSTVCAGYAGLYMDILNRCGIPCILVESASMEHVWNLVQLEGSWFHVDVTWDDPTPDRYGYVSHEYFLVTDQEVQQGEEPHYDWVSPYTCQDTRFSDAHWKNVESPILFESSAVSYLLRTEDFTNYVCRRDELTGRQTVLYTDDEPYVDIGYGNYTYQRRGLALRDGRLWFSTLDALRSVSTEGGKVRTEHTHEETASYIHSFHILDDQLLMSYADHDGNTTAAAVSLAATENHRHSYAETTVAPTCTEGGYTLCSCQCGVEYEAGIVAPTGHAYKRTGGKNASFLSGGYRDEECTVCGHTQTVELPQMTFLHWLLSLFGLWKQ